jgi:hypothetical protein
MRGLEKEKEVEVAALVLVALVVSGDGALGGKRGGRGGKGSAGSRVGGGSMYVWWKEERT